MRAQNCFEAYAHVRKTQAGQGAACLFRRVIRAEAAALERKIRRRRRWNPGKQAISAEKNIDSDQ